MGCSNLGGNSLKDTGLLFLKICHVVRFFDVFILATHEFIMSIVDVAGELVSRSWTHQRLLNCLNFGFNRLGFRVLKLRAMIAIVDIS